MNKILLVDFSNLIARTFYSFNVRTSTGISSSMFFGTLKVLYNKIKKFKINEVYICYDKKPYWKKTIFENYKSNRRGLEESLGTTYEEYIEQSNDLKLLLPNFGFKCMSYPSFESDDLIAALSWKLSKNKDNEIFIYSTDHDFFQLIDDNVKVLKTTKGKDIIIDKNNFFEKTGIINTELFKNILAFSGDGGDNIPSIFAKRIVNEDNTETWVDPPRIISFSKVSKILSSPHNSVENLLNGKINPVKGIGGKTENLFIKINEEQREAFNRNLKLVSLQDGGHKYDILEENKALLKIEIVEEPKKELIKHLLQKYECDTISVDNVFPFYYIIDNKTYIPKIDKNNFLNMMKKAKNRHFS